MATLITPNLPEAELLLGRAISDLDAMREANRRLTYLVLLAMLPWLLGLLLVGPVLAAQFGYLPGTLWILIGVVLGGAVQD